MKHHQTMFLFQTNNQERLLQWNTFDSILVIKMETNIKVNLKPSFFVRRIESKGIGPLRIFSLVFPSYKAWKLYSIAPVCFELSEIILKLNLSKIKNVHSCQRSVGTFVDDYERLYSIMVKTNKRSGDRVNSGRCF